MLYCAVKSSIAQYFDPRQPFVDAITPMLTEYCLKSISKSKLFKSIRNIINNSNGNSILTLITLSVNDFKQKVDGRQEYSTLKSTLLTKTRILRSSNRARYEILGYPLHTLVNKPFLSRSL